MTHLLLSPTKTVMMTEHGWSRWVVWKEHVWFCTKSSNSLSECCTLCIAPSGEFHRIPALAAANNCGFGHSNRCAVVSLCPFSLHFPGEVEWGTSNVIIYHSHTSFGEVFVQISRTFLIWSFSYCGSFKNSLNIVYTHLHQRFLYCKQFPLVSGQVEGKVG